MKRIFALVIALMLLLSFAGCSQEAENTELPEETPNTESENEYTEESLALYEEILLGFGGTRKHDGSLIVSRKGSLYDLREGIEDCSAMTPDTYYTWVASKTENSDKTKVMLSGSDSEVYAYSADFFESKVTEYFGVTAEYLQESVYYHSEENCYYCEDSAAIGEYVQIDFLSAEENEDSLTLFFTLTDSTNGTANFSLTVKLLADGGYNYISYLPA